MQIKTIADFKRAMIKGTKWHSIHEFTGDNPKPPVDMGVRECGLNNSVDFGFIIPEKSGRVSHCNWPKKSEFSTDGQTVTIDSGWVVLKYKEVK